MRSLQDIALLDADKWQSFLAFRERRINGFKTGVSRLDSEILGLAGIVGIQGAPGSCKSTLALQIASFQAAQGTPALIVDRENGLNRFKVRLACQLNEVSQTEILTCSLEKLKGYMSKLKGLPIYVDTSPDVTIDAIRSYLDDMLELYKRPVLLVVDSLQALPRFGAEERTALEQWLCQLDQIKLDYGANVVIIVTSEKRRGTYNEATKEGGKGTGAIEFKAELLLDVRTEPDSPVIYVQIVKNRDGATSGDLMFQRKLAGPNSSSFCFKLEEFYGEDL